MCELLNRMISTVSLELEIIQFNQKNLRNIEMILNKLKN